MTDHLCRFEFRYGDRVKTTTAPRAYGTVVDERRQKVVMGDFAGCLPLPVAVLFDEPGEVWWVPGTELELA